MALLNSPELIAGLPRPASQRCASGRVSIFSAHIGATRRRYAPRAGSPSHNIGREVWMRTAEEERWAYHRLSALRQIAEHIGATSKSKYLRPPPEEVQRRRDKYGHSLVPLSRAVALDPNETPFQRAVFSLLLEILSPGWRDGVDPVDLGPVAERSDKEARAWRREVLKRDSRACTKCGSTNQLEAHHIVRWADEPALRLVVSNGITLCKPCHLKEHFPHS